MSVESYFISTPYIDAYEHDWEPESPKVDLATFTKRMVSQAYSWGETAVGRATLTALRPAMHDGAYVLAFGVHGDQKYVAVSRPGDRVEVVAVDSYPDEWNVT